MKQINCTVTGHTVDTPRLYTDDQGPSGPYFGVWESPSRIIFSVPDGIMGGAFIVSAGFEVVRLVLPVFGSMEGPVLDYKPSIKRLHAGDEYLVDDNGERVVLGLSTDFKLFKMFLDGDDIDGVVSQRTAAGALGFRVLGMCDFLFKLDPKAIGGYYEELRDFAAQLANQGLYLQFTALADAQGVSVADQQLHWRQSCEALRDAPNAFCELANENLKNGVDARQFVKPAGAGLVSSGSWCDGWEPTGGWGDIVTFHSARTWKWPVTVPATVAEIRREYAGQRKPVWIGEPMGAADVDEPGRRSSDPALFEKLGVSIGVFAAGGVFHSEAGLRSDLWSERQQQCAEAFFRGLHR